MSTERPKRIMPKGGRKGGTQFPQISLAKAVDYAKKLVSKTHNGAQPESVILKGAFGAAGSKGRIRASAMKQYGFLQGVSAAYEATQLAKSLVAAPDDEKRPLLKQALLKAKVFKALFDTFVADTVTVAKIRQQAAQLEVHPENLDLAVRTFIESAIYAGLATQEGENITLAGHAEVPAVDNSPPDEATNGDMEEADEDDTLEGDEPEVEPDAKSKLKGAAPRAIVNVNVTLDSSLDTEKLEKQLKLLRRYGAI